MKDFTPKDSAGRWRTRSLIKELSSVGQDCPYTLAEMHDIYIETMDPTEYEAARKLLGSWEHWQALAKSVAFNPILSKWREEMSVHIRSRAIMYISDLAIKENGFQAARWLAEKGWIEKAAKGRPKKDDVERAAKEAAGVRESIEEDGARISLLRS